MARTKFVETLALILAGSFVTTTKTGDTIPTWPATWGRTEAPGWFVEASHRYVAAAVGLLVLSLVLWLQRAESRPEFHPWFTRLQIKLRDDPLAEVLIVQKILSETARRFHADSREAGLNF